MKVGAEPKKVAILAGLGVVAAVILYTNATSTDGPPRTASSRPSPAAVAPPQPTPQPAARSASPSAAPRAANAAQTLLERPAARTNRGERGSSEFRPSLKPRRPEDRPDPTTIDPTLRLELLARLQNVKLEGGERSLFEFSQPKPPKAPDVKIVPKSPGAAKEAAETKPEPPKPAEAVKPPPPPITLKFYGYISPLKQGVKRAFFLDGDEIVVAGEGDLIKRRYKVVRIGVSSVVVEDTEHKHQQTLALEEQAG